MAYHYFSHNGTALPMEQAVVPLSSVEYSYGFGVYETIRVAKGRPYFMEQHIQRLMESATAIGLPHKFSEAAIATAAQELIIKNEAGSCNLKILLIGGATPETADLYMLCLNPLFPDRKLYSQGAAAVTYHYEREFPHAKTLNMLSSYLAYRKARSAGAYDALLINRTGCITEGTRTNFLAIKGQTIITPPAETLLLGVMRSAVLEVAQRHEFEIIEQDIKMETIQDYDGAFLTSTSSKIMPLRSIDDHTWSQIPPALRELMTLLDEYLDKINNETALPL